MRKPITHAERVDGRALCGRHLTNRQVYPPSDDPTCLRCRRALLFGLQEPKKPAPTGPFRKNSPVTKADIEELWGLYCAGWTLKQLRSIKPGLTTQDIKNFFAQAGYVIPRLGTSRHARVAVKRDVKAIKGKTGVTDLTVLMAGIQAATKMDLVELEDTALEFMKRHDILAREHPGLAKRMTPDGKRIATERRLRYERKRATGLREAEDDQAAQ